MSLIMLLNYIQTFAVYPGVMLAFTINSLDENWQVLLMVTTFNIFDTIGRWSSSFRSLYNRTMSVVVVFFRFIGIGVFCLLAFKVTFGYEFMSAYWLCFVNIAVFGLTNGFATGTLLILAPEVFEGPEKEYSGYVMVISMNFGIMIGTLIAVPIGEAITNHNG